jgi:hypothetical protein
VTWVIGATGGGPLGRLLVRPYLAQFDLDAVRLALPHATARRIDDPNVAPRERAAVRELIER